jgi:hypothetical protein
MASIHVNLIVVPSARVVRARVHTESASADLVYLMLDVQNSLNAQVTLEYRDLQKAQPQLLDVEDGETARLGVPGTRLLYFQFGRLALACPVCMVEWMESSMEPGHVQGGDTLIDSFDQQQRTLVALKEHVRRHVCIKWKVDDQVRHKKLFSETHGT